MNAKLKKVCKKCTNESIKVYMRNIRRLHRLIGDNEIPETSAWLKKKELMDKYKKLPLIQRRHLSTAAVKAAKAYGDEKMVDVWSKEMYKDSQRYTEKRMLNKISDVEKAKWPKGGFASLKKASTEFKRRIGKIFRQEPSKANLYTYTKYIILRFYAAHAMRNDLASFTLSGEGNKLTWSKGAYTVLMTEFKTKKSMGPTSITLNKGLSKAMREYVKYRNKVGVDHDFLLSNAKGKPLTRAAMGKILGALTKDLLDKQIGSRIIRVLKATAFKKEIDVSDKLAKEMMHSSKQQKAYVRNKDGD